MEQIIDNLLSDFERGKVSAASSCKPWLSAPSPETATTAAGRRTEEAEGYQRQPLRIRGTGLRQDAGFLFRLVGHEGFPRTPASSAIWGSATPC
jgi:hypothetical protein